MKKIFYFVIALILVIAAISAFLVLNRTTKTMSKAESEAALAKMLGRKPNLDVKDAPTGNVAYNGKYVYLMYPAMAKIYTYRDPGSLTDKNMVENFSFDIADPRLIFNLGVSQNPDSVMSLDDISAVRLREDKSRGYQQAEASVDGQKGLTFTRSDQQQSEKTGIFMVNGKTYSISVTGNDTKEVANLFDNVIKSLRFLK
jgi:hypothetical protein